MIDKSAMQAYLDKLFPGVLGIRLDELAPDPLADGQFHEAVECFSRAIRLRPEVSAGYRYRAYALLELGDRIRALNDLDQAVRLKPDDPQAYADRAAELFAQKQFDQAIADCDKVLSLDPGRAPLQGLRGRCHAERGHPVHKRMNRYCDGPRRRYPCRAGMRCA